MLLEKRVFIIWSSTKTQVNSNSKLLISDSGISWMIAQLLVVHRHPIAGIVGLVG